MMMEDIEDIALWMVKRIQIQSILFGYPQNIQKCVPTYLYKP